MNIDGKWLTETEATAYVRELKQRISTLEDLNDRLMKENGKLEKQLEVVQTAKGIGDMQIAHYENDWKNTVGAIAVSEIERLRTENKKAKELLKAAVEDMKDILSSASGCRCCKGEEAASCAYIKCWTWRYEDKALALIGEDGDINA